jgi:hypothetical protein
MHKKILLVFLLSPACFFSYAQNKKFDSTLKMGDVGYRIICNNKKLDDNSVSIKPIGFKNYSQNLEFRITGILNKAMIDDYNNDGYPDLFFYSFDEKNRAQPYCLASVTNTSCAPVYMPDVYTDPKLREGYQGHDTFTSMGGFLIRKFPVYQTDSIAKNPTVIATRVVEYKAKANTSNSGNPSYKFEVFKSYDIKQ